MPVGGGKDSVVSLAALRAAGEDAVALSVGRKPSADAAAEAEGVPMLHVERHISPELFALNAAGASTAMSRSPRSSPASPWSPRCCTAATRW